MFLSITMPKKKTKTYKEMMAEILKPKKVAPSPEPKGLGRPRAEAPMGPMKAS